MERSVRLRLGFAAPVLAALYFYLLVFLISGTSAKQWPSWWFGIFPTRHITAVTWMVLLHTIAVFSAALPRRRRGSGHRARKSRIARGNRGRSGDYPGGITVTERRYLAGCLEGLSDFFHH
jgi:hypothetical protein